MKENIFSVFYTREKMKLKEIKLFTESVAEEPKPLDCCTLSSLGETENTVSTLIT